MTIPCFVKFLLSLQFTRDQMKKNCSCLLQFIICCCFLGTGKLGFSFVRITSLMLTNDRLWVGTGNGVILSVPLVAARPARDDGETPTSSPGTGGSGGPGGAVRVYSNEGKDGDAPRGSSFMPYCSMVSTTLPGVIGVFFLWWQHVRS